MSTKGTRKTISNRHYLSNHRLHREWKSYFGGIRSSSSVMPQVVCTRYGKINDIRPYRFQIEHSWALVSVIGGNGFVWTIDYVKWTSDQSKRRIASTLILVRPSRLAVEFCLLRAESSVPVSANLDWITQTGSKAKDTHTSIQTHTFIHTYMVSKCNAFVYHRKKGGR